MMKSFEEFQTLGKDGMEAYVASASAVTKGLQTIAQEAAEYSRKSFEKGSQAMEKVTAVKSFDKAIEVQTEYAKSAFETFVAESQKIAAIYADLAKQSFKPFEGLAAKLVPATTH